MRIVLVNWAKVWDGAPVGGGVNGYCQSVALELTQRGHEVVYLCSGVQFTPDPAAPDIRPGPCMVRRHPDWLGIRVFEVVNSPVLAPSGYQFRSPTHEISAPILEARVGELMALLRPDIVHFNNIEGLSAGCIAAVRGACPECAVLYSLHNYHTLCPQVYLMHRHLFPCHDYDNGRACETCIESVDPDAERRRRSAEWGAAVKFTPVTIAKPARSPIVDPLPVPTTVRPGRIRRALSALFERERVERAPAVPSAPGSLVVSPAPTLPLPGFAADSPHAVEYPITYPAADPRGQTGAVLGESRPARVQGPGDREWEPLTNEVRPVKPATGEPNGYALRRRAMMAMLNSCDGVLAVSEFVRAKFESLGVDPARLRTLHIGTRVGKVAERFKELLYCPPPFEAVSPRPIRVVFMGYNNLFKGLPMLADALELLTPEVLSRFHLYLYAQSLETIEWRFRRMEPRLAGLTVANGYQYHDIPWLLGGKDLGLVTSVWWDNAPQTVFEFFGCGVPVLAADIGGIPDFVRDGENGLLFRANDRYDLARRLAEVARDPSRLAGLRANVRAPKDMATHAEELEAVYAQGAVLRRGMQRAFESVEGRAGLPASS